MKKILTTLVIIAISAFYSLAAPKNNSGFWVIESNTKNLKLATVKFYDDEQKLIYQETVNNRLKADDKRTQKILNEILAVLMNKRMAVANNDLCAVFLK